MLQTHFPSEAFFDRWNSEAHTAACLQAMNPPAFLESRGRAVTDRLSCRRQLTVAGPRKWLIVDEQGDAAIVEASFNPLASLSTEPSYCHTLLGTLLTQMTSGQHRCNPC